MTRVLFHVNHLWGVGHFTRTAAIAAAIVESGGAAAIITGNTPVEGRVHPSVKLFTLPAVRAPDTRYRELVDLHGYPVTPELWVKRRALIDAALADFRPDVLVTETFPFGRRKLADELLHLVAAAKSAGAAIVSSIRDIPFVPEGERRLAECAERLRAWYDVVLIHGDERIFPLPKAWPGDVPVPVHFTGFVTAQPPARVPDDQRRGVIVSAGGGGDAAAVLETAMAAWEAGGLLPGEPWLFVTGTLAPEGLYEALMPRAKRQLGAELVHSVSDFPERLARARLSISRGGSTSIEAVAAGTRAVVIPCIADGQPEQGIRAAQFAAQHLLIHLPEAEIAPASLTAAGQAALAAPAPAPGVLRLDGAARSAALLAQVRKRG